MGHPRAVGLINDSTGRLVWLHAAAGMGKTSLALEWISATARPTAWMRVDETDTDPACFFAGLQQAIAHAGIAPGWEAPQLVGEHLPSMRGYIRLFVRSLALCLVPRAALVLDDAHEIHATAFLPFLLTALAEECPLDMTTLVLSRQAPPADSARLQVHGAMQVLPTQALMLSPVETERLLQFLGVQHAQAVRDAAFRVTRGWPAGVAMAAACLRQRPDVDLESAIARYATAQDYFAQEVLGFLPPVEQDALLTLCWLPSIPEQHAGAFVDGHIAEAVQRLLSQGALMYRYAYGQCVLHPLLQTVLRGRAVEMLGPDECARRVTVCIELLASTGETEQALELALAHRMLDRAARLIAGMAPAMARQSCFHTLCRWIDAIPAESRCAELHYWHGMALRIADSRRARESLQRALELMDDQDPALRLRAVSALVGTYFFEGVGTVPLGSVLQRYLADEHRNYDAVTDPQLRAHLVFSVGTAISNAEPGNPEWPRWEQRALDLVQDPCKPEARIRLVSMLAHEYFFSGRHRRLRELCKLLQAQPQPEGLSSYARVLTHLMFHYEALVGTGEELDEVYAQGRRCSEETGISIMDGHFALFHAAALMIQGQVEKASAMVERVAAQTPPGHYIQLAHLSMVRAWLANWTGVSDVAREHARAGMTAARRVGSEPFFACAYLAETIAVAQSDPQCCPPRLHELRQLGERLNYPHLLAQADLLQAWLALTFTSGAGDAVSQPLASGLRRLAESGTELLLLNVPAILTPLCHYAVRENVLPDQVAPIIRKFRIEPPEEDLERWPWQVHVRCLGSFQLCIDGREHKPERKSKHRQMDLLKALAAHASRTPSAKEVAAMLWPDADADSAQRNLNTTLSRLRSLLGPQSIVSSQGSLSLNERLVWVDVAPLQTQLNALDRDVAFSSADQVEAVAWKLAHRYSGHLLAGEQAPWAAQLRASLCSRVVGALVRAALSVAEAGRHDAASNLMVRALDIDPCSDPAMRALLQMLIEQGRHGVGLQMYRRFQSAARMQRLMPSRELERLAQVLYAGTA